MKSFATTTMSSIGLLGIIHCTATTEELLEQRDSLSSVLWENDLDPDSFLNSEDFLNLSPDERVWNFHYSLVSSKHDLLFRELEERVTKANLTNGTTIRNYRPPGRAVQIVRELSFHSMLHEIQYRTLVTPNYLHLLVPRGTKTIIEGCHKPGLYSMREINPDHFADKAMTQAEIIREGLAHARFTDENSMDRAIGQYFTFFKPYPPIAEAGDAPANGIPGFYRLHSHPTDVVVTFTTWFQAIFEWGQDMSAAMQCDPGWPLPISALPTTFPQLYAPIPYNIYEVTGENRQRTPDSHLRYVLWNPIPINWERYRVWKDALQSRAGANLENSAWTRRQHQLFTAVLTTADYNPQDFLTEEPWDPINLTQLAKYKFPDDKWPEFQEVIEAISVDNRKYMTEQDDYTLLCRLAPTSPFHDIMREIHAEREGLNAVRVVRQTVWNSPQALTDTLVCREIAMGRYPGYTGVAGNGDKVFLEPGEYDWHRAEPGLYYGLESCDDGPGQRFIPQKVLQQAVLQYILFFKPHTLLISRYGEPRYEPWAVGFPMIEFNGGIPNRHRITMMPWAIFVSFWSDYWRALQDQALPLCLSNQTRLYNFDVNVFQRYPGPRRHPYQNEVYYAKQRLLMFYTLVESWEPTPLTQEEITAGVRVYPSGFDVYEEFYGKAFHRRCSEEEDGVMEGKPINLGSSQPIVVPLRKGVLFGTR